MSSNIWIWKNIPGFAGRCNDIIYARPILLPSEKILVYFGGDVQDTLENMEKHPDSRKYTEWNLQNTARILSTKFPKMHVLVVRPFRMYMTNYAMFSCFDNFVPGKEYGIPTFCPMHNAINHLRELIKNSLNQLKTCNINEDVDCSTTEANEITLMGFSKGCVVLNQLLHELYYYQSKSEPDTEVNSFVKGIRSMWWLDGGHGGSKDTWITDATILESFSKLRINVHVHVTPYQVEDSNRPWIRKEENLFSKTLKNMGVSVERSLHFTDKPRSLELHFKIHDVIGNCTQ